MRRSWRSRRCRQRVSVGESEEDGDGVGEDNNEVGVSVPAVSPPLAPNAERANATMSTAAIPITAIVASRARVGGPVGLFGTGGGAACRGADGRAAGSGSDSGADSGTST